MWKTQLFKLNYDNREKEAVDEVLSSGWITMGEKTELFEKSFAEFIGGGTSAISTSSGTAALHLSLLALGINNGDEVIVPSLTFVADVNSVLMTRATPVLADCTSYDDWNVSADTIAKKITPKTKAVVIVHFAGYSCDMDDIISLCNDKNIALIEDVAHAPGSTYKGVKAGSFGDFGCFSFFTNKNLSVGEGGMVTTKDKESLNKVKHLRSHGMSAQTLDRHKGRSVSYDVLYSGLNYRIDEMRSALGLVQLEKLPNANKRRELLTKRYISNLSVFSDSVTTPFLNLNYENESSHHIMPILLNKKLDRLSIIEYMKKEGIQTSIHYPSFKNFTAFKDLNITDVPISEDISDRELTLPLYPDMSFEQIDEVCEILLKGIKL